MSEVEIEIGLIPWEINEASKGLPKAIKQTLLKMRNQDNSLTIAKCILSMKHEINLSDNYRNLMITVLANLSKFVDNKQFLDITREDFVLFLDSHRKPEPIDPLHKWIGTYNYYLVVISRFFKWLYNPNLPQKERKKPDVIQNIPKLKRKETSIYKPTDLWTNEDDIIFLNYCKSKRDKCYHMVARDTSCRPSEILNLKLKDIVFKKVGDKQYAEIHVNGKTGTRSILLINSIPYVKDYLDEHPQKNNPNAYFIFGLCKSYGKKLSSDAMLVTYTNYKKIFFPKLLENPTVSPEDKVKIKELLKKPWNPYIRRHTALTEKSQILKENVLRQYAGWSMGSNMHLKYIHYLGNESSESILEAYGYKQKNEEIDKMKPKQCPNCMELNKIDSKFCVKCRMILSYDSYLETMEEKEQTNEVIANLADRITKLTEDIEVLKNISHN